MSRVKRLIGSFSQFISVPWRDDAAAAQRVIFCVYHETEERALRTKIDEFELASRQAGHDWYLHDLTDTFAEWLTSQRYAKSYFEKPDLLATIYPKYLEHLAKDFEYRISELKPPQNFVIAISGVGSLFGFVKVKDLVDRLAPMVSGRLVIFFPGSYEENNYRLLDGYDGWNYLAVPITADKTF
jgi:hypothetical protein